MRALSKRLSYVLRHDPRSIGIELDRNGWVEVDELLAGLARRGRRVTREELEQVVRENDKQRFALQGGRIRAQQGHSVPVQLELQERTPPPVLYHGTVERALPSILQEGLKPQGRHAVHLSGDEETARRVGARRGRPVVLTVDAAAMAQEGRRFQVSGNGVWLTEAVPPQHLRRGDDGA